MPTRNVNLTDELDRFVAKKAKTGRYENASEVVRQKFRPKPVTHAAIEDPGSGALRKFPERKKVLEGGLTACYDTRSELVRR